MYEWANERKCPKCGKIFYVTPEWVYKDVGGIYCSWKCYRKSTERKRFSEEKNYRYKPVEQLNYEGEVIRVYKNLEEAIIELDANYGNLSGACRNGTKYKGYLWRYKTDDVSKV